MKKAAFGAGLFIFGCFMLCLSKTATSSDISDSAVYSYSINIQPTSSQQYAKSTFLPDRFDDLGLSDYDTLNNNYNLKNCESYPLTSCPTGGRCERCPFNSKLFRLYACTSPYILSGGTCTCPAKVTLGCTNDKCTQYCGSTCIKKSCSPLANQTGCTNGTQNCDNGCCAQTRKCCVPCANKVTSKPANSSYTYSSCKDGSGSHQIQTGWKCNSGYHEKNGSCEKDCIANSCSGYSLTSCPANATCNSCSKQTTTCGGAILFTKRPVVIQDIMRVMVLVFQIVQQTLVPAIH